MDVQTLIVALVVVAALLFVGRGFYRTIASARGRKNGACGGGCGCGPSH